eukprot:977477_1
MQTMASQSSLYCSTCIVLYLRIAFIAGMDATVTMYCDDYGKLLHSYDYGGEWVLDAQNSWAEPATAVIRDATATTVIRALCTDNVHNGGFIAQVTYGGTSYYTTNPITAGYWRIVSAESGLTAPLNYGRRACCWDIDSNAWVVWNNIDADTVTFEFRMNRIIGLPTKQPTPEPTPNPTKNTNMPTSNPTKRPTSNPTKTPTITPTQAPVPIVPLLCDHDTAGPYNGNAIHFHTTMAFFGRLTFDASASNFVVRNIEIYDAFDALIVHDAGKVSFIADVGTYTIMMEGDSDVSGVYRATITCALIADVFTTTDLDTQVSKVITAEYVTYLIFGALSLSLCCLCLCIVFCLYKKNKPLRELEMIPSVPNDIDISPVVQWLKEQVYLAQYTSLFIQNGFDSLEAIAQIKSREVLKSIGIHDKAHQVLIMIEIAKLKDDYYNNMEGQMEDASSLTQVVFDTNCIIMEDNSSSSSDTSKPDESDCGLSRIDLCAECGDTKTGRYDKDCAMFFCNECWKIYEDTLANDDVGETIC